MQTQAVYDRSGPKLSLVLGIVWSLAVVLGVLAYWRYTVSETFFARSLQEMSERGKTLSVEACVDAVIDWHANCEANKPLCDEGVVRAMTHCVMAADRHEYCDALEVGSARAQWVFARCEERGTRCVRRKACPCADAYRTLDSFCRHGEKGVAL